MYKSAHECLKRSFYLLNVCIEPKNNTQQICEHMAKRGGRESGGHGLNQHDVHAQAALVQKSCEMHLSRFEYAAIEAEYGRNLSGIVDLSLYITTRHPQIGERECDLLLEQVITGKPTMAVIEKKVQTSLRKLWYDRKTVRGIYLEVLTSAIEKMELCWINSGLIYRLENNA